MRCFVCRGDLTTRGLPAAHQTAHPASQSGHRTSLASGVVLMLSPARKTRVCPMRVAGKTDRPSTGRRYYSATSSPAPGALPESLGQPPNLLGARHRNHSGTVSQNWLAIGLLHASEKYATMAKLKDWLGKRGYAPRGLPAKPIGRSSDAGTARP